MDAVIALISGLRVDTVIAVISAIAAVGAALYARNALIPAKAAVLSEWLSQYSSDDMGKAMRLLSAWQKQYGPGFAEKYREAMRDKPNDGETKELMAARRRVSQFFKNLARLNRTDLLEDRVIATVFGRRPFDFCVQVLEPLDQAHSQQVITEADDPYWSAFYQRIRRKAEKLGVV